MTKREHRKIVTEPFYRDFELYNRTEEKCREGFYKDMLDKSIDDIEAILSNHHKINVIRFDLYFTKPDNEEEYFRMEPSKVNGYVSTFFKYLQDKMVGWTIPNKNTGKLENRKIKRNRIAYQYAMEETADKLVHVHAYIAYKGLARADGAEFADENGKYKGIYRKIDETWRSVVPNGYGRVRFGSDGWNNHFYSIYYKDPDFQEKIEDCIYGMSYVAKVFSKNAIEVKNVRRYNSSRRIERGSRDMKLTGRKHSKGVEPITESPGIEELMEVEVA